MESQAHAAVPAVQVAARNGHRRALVAGARTALVMLVIAGAVMVGLGIVTRVLTDPPEVDGWLRSAFGSVFSTMAFAMAGVLAIPSLVGLWAMAGATADDARPALGYRVRMIVAGCAVATVAGAGIALLLSGRGATLLDIVLTGLVALMVLGLAGAAASSPHQGRARLSAGALALVIAVIAWVVVSVIAGISG
jgi:hypothetical protein